MSDDRIAEALQEALLFMEAPPGSPRHWAVSRGNLTKLLTEAIEQRKQEAEQRKQEAYVRSIP